jgi:hypothetical protein
LESESFSCENFSSSSNIIDKLFEIKFGAEGIFNIFGGICVGDIKESIISLEILYNFFYFI